MTYQTKTRMIVQGILLLIMINLSLAEPSCQSDRVCPYQLPPTDLKFAGNNKFEDLFNWLDEYVSSKVDENIRPSVVAELVYKEDTVWSGYFGRIEKGSDKKPDADTIYRVGSISKLFPVFFLFKLWEEGKVDLYDPITKYEPDFSIGRPFGSTSDITLIDMASQISGLPESLPYDPITGHPFVWDGTSDEALQLLKKHWLVAEPRTKCSYSNIAYVFLADILAKRFTEDGSFENWVQMNVLDRLQLTNTGFHYDEDVIKRMATGYFPDGSVADIYEIFWYSPASNYYSSVGDLTKISKFLLETSTTILEHETISELLRSRKVCKPGYLANITGSPWEITEQHQYRVIRKDGGFDGYTETMVLVPELKLAFNVMMSGGWPENMAEVVMDRAIPIFRDAMDESKTKLTPTPDPAKYIGEYNFNGTEFKTILEGSGGVLLMNITGNDIAVGLSYVSDGVFTLNLLDGVYPCDYFVLLQFDVQNGAVLNFYNFENDRYNEFIYYRRNIFNPQSGNFVRNNAMGNPCIAFFSLPCSRLGYIIVLVGLVTKINLAIEPLIS